MRTISLKIRNFLSESYDSDSIEIVSINRFIALMINELK